MSPDQRTRVLFVVTLLLMTTLYAKQEQSISALSQTLQIINAELKQQIDNNTIIPSAELNKRMKIARRAAGQLDNKGNAQQKSQAQRIILSIVQKRNTLLTRAQENAYKVANAFAQLHAIKSEIVSALERGTIMGGSVVQEKLKAAHALGRIIDELGNKNQKQTAQRIIQSIVQAQQSLLRRGGNDLVLINQLQTINNWLAQTVADGTVVPKKQIKNEFLTARHLARQLETLTSQQYKDKSQNLMFSITQNNTILMERAKQHADESIHTLKQLRVIHQKLADTLNGMKTTLDLKNQLKTAQHLAQKLDHSGTTAQKKRARKLILSIIKKRNRLLATADRNDGIFRETSNIKQLVSLWSDLIERAHDVDNGELAALFEEECEDCLTQAKMLVQNVHKRKKEARRLVEDMLEAQQRMFKVSRQQKLNQTESEPEQTASLTTTIDASQPKITTVATQELEQIKLERKQKAKQLKREQKIITWLHNVIAQLAHEATSIQQTGRITVSAHTLHEIAQETTSQVEHIVSPQNMQKAKKLLASVQEGQAAVRKHAKALIQKTEKAFYKILAADEIKDIKKLRRQVQHFIRTVQNGVPERAFAMEDDLYERLAQLEYEEEQLMAHKAFAKENTKIAATQNVAHDKHAFYTTHDIQQLINQKLNKLSAAPNKTALTDAAHELSALFKSLEKKFDWAYTLVQKNKGTAIALLHDWDNRHQPSSRFARVRNWFKRSWNNLKTIANMWRGKKMKA